MRDILANFPPPPPSTDGIEPQGIEDGKPVWCAIVYTKHGVVLGKAFDTKTCYYSYGGKEHQASHFKIFDG
jgi:hypothetical protein